MEITMNDVIAFIDNAMSKNLGMEGFNGTYPEIRIVKKGNDIITFRINKSCLYIYNDIIIGNSITIKDLSEVEIATFKLMCAKVIEYSQNKLRSYFWDFFKEDEKPPTINDLDSEDD